MTDERAATCRETRKALLEADLTELEELQVTEATALGRHVASCETCGRAARAILRGTEELGAWLTRPGGEPDVEDLLRRADLRVEGDEHAEAGPSDRGEDEEVPRVDPVMGRKLRWALPLAAAAAVAALILTDGDRPGTPFPPAEETRLAPAEETRLASAEPSLDLEVPEGRTAAVFETDDPDITVIWLLDDQGGDR